MHCMPVLGITVIEKHYKRGHGFGLAHFGRLLGLSFE